MRGSKRLQSKLLKAEYYNNRYHYSDICYKFGVWRALNYMLQDHILHPYRVHARTREDTRK